MAFLAPNARWQGRGPTGEPIIGGKLYTYEAGTEIPKITWQDHAQSIQNTNPVILDGKGEANIYWADDEYYRIILYTEDDQEVDDQDDYPWLVNQNVVPPVDLSKKNNVVRNPQFTYWSNGSTLTNINTSSTNFDFIADDWLFRRTNTTSTINASKVALSLTDSTVPGDPVNFVSISCAAVGTPGESQLELYQRYESVRTFAGQSVVLTFSAKVVGAVSATITAHAYQNFGTGGSPSAEADNSFGTFNLTQAMQEFSAVITLASLSGKTQGTNLDDALLLAFKFPSDVLFQIQLGTVQLIPGEEAVDFDYLSQNDQFMRIYGNKNAWFSSGDYKHTIKTTADSGWILCDNGTIGSLASGASHAGMYTRALYNVIWNISNTYCPIFTSSGAVSTRGASAILDFDANKQLSLTRNLGMALAGYNPSGLPIIQKDFTGDVGNDALQLNDNAAFYTGTAVTFSNIGGALPTTTPQITTLGTYYVISSAANRIKLATTLALAVAGTADIVIGSVGTGRNIVSIPGAVKAMGEYLGEDSHADTIAEHAIHNHGAGTLKNTGDIIEVQVDGVEVTIAALATVGAGTPVDIDINSGSSGSSGSSHKHNNIQPTLYVNTMFKL